MRARTDLLAFSSPPSDAVTCAGRAPGRLDTVAASSALGTAAAPECPRPRNIEVDTVAACKRAGHRRNSGVVEMPEATRHRGLAPWMSLGRRRRRPRRRRLRVDPEDLHADRRKALSASRCHSEGDGRPHPRQVRHEPESRAAQRAVPLGREVARPLAVVAGGRSRPRGGCRRRRRRQPRGSRARPRVPGSHQSKTAGPTLGQTRA